MLDVKPLIDAIVKELYSFTGQPVVMLEQDAPKPPYPFVSYKVTTPYNPERGYAAESWETVPSTDPRFEHDIQYTRAEQPTMTISITAYSDNQNDAYDLALKTLSWFSYYGRDYLQLKNLVVVQTTAVQNRDTLIVGDYERREGFDVILRTESKLQKTIETIEQVELI